MTDTPSGKPKLTSGRLLAKNAIWNLIGQGVPLVAAIFAIPIFISQMGTARFGLLTLAWVIIGYFSLFDLGLGRALTKLVADRLGDREEATIPGVVWTALFLMLFLGIVGAVVVAVLTPWMVYSALIIPRELQKETLIAFYMLAASIPVVIITAGLRGYLEAHQRFGFINAVRVPMGVYNFCAPLLVLPFNQSLHFVVAVLVAGRMAAAVIHLLLCFRVTPALRHQFGFQRETVKPLVAFGSWMTVTNVISPLMIYIDRFLIGAVLSVSVVAYYTTPYEIVSKLFIVPTALVGVMFPAFAFSLRQDPRRAALIFGRGANYVFLSMFPLILVIVTLAHDGLDIWVGPEFAAQSTAIMQFLAVGVFFNALARVPFALVQSAGRPDMVAKLQVVILPFYLVALWMLMRVDGIRGVAIAWSGRTLIDMVVLSIMASRFLPQVVADIRRIGLAIVGAVAILAAGALIAGLALKGLFLVVTLGAFAIVTWLLVLSVDERKLVRDTLKAVIG